MSENTPPLILVDGSSYLFRAFHAMPPLNNAQGEPTGAIFGVANMLRRLINEYSPTQMAVVFDAKGKTFRHEMYDEYKANRPPMPDELRCQIEPLHHLIDAMGLPRIVITGVEADDVIGTLAKQAQSQGIPTLISTGDKDMAQLVDEHVTLINTMNDHHMDKTGVIEKFGVSAEQIVDYLALMGDTSDNIPGVPKVGPKTAAKWLQKYGSLESLVEHANEIKGKVGENLRAHLEQLPLAKSLTTIKCDVELPVNINDLQIHTDGLDELKTMVKALGFRTWLNELEQNETDTPAGTSAKPDQENTPEYEIVDDLNRFQEWLEQLKQAEYFAFDTETTSLMTLDAEIVGVSFAFENGKAAYVPCAHDYDDAPAQLDRETVLQALKPLLESTQYKKIGHNLKYDMSVLANYNIQLHGILNDTMLESYVCNSTASNHNMDALAKYYLNVDTTHYEDIAGKGVKQLTFNRIPIGQAGPYAAEDADITLRLHQHLETRMKEETRLVELLQTIELPLAAILSEMERYGVLIDAQLLQTQSEELAARMKEIETQAFEIAEGEFNLSSPKQIQEILFQRQKLPVLKKTPKGQPSTAEEVLQELALDYPLPKLILEYRSMSKLKSTYTDKLPKQIHTKSGRVHTSYHQAVASTGRLSSSDPNLQNIPVRTAEGRRIRQAFIAPQDHLVVAADYSQIELRIMAHLSADKSLLDAFKQGLDIHSATAAEIFSTHVDAVSHEQRRRAKAINFGLIYGMSAFGLAKQLGIERSDAQAYVNLYFERYPGVKAYMERTREEAKERGYVETVFGRRLYLAEINARNAQRRQYAERAAINAPMQGTAADIIKKAMISVHDWIQTNQTDVKMIMQVHDELVFEIHRNDLENACDAIRQRMSHAAELHVPLVVDIGSGKNWDEAH